MAGCRQACSRVGRARGELPEMLPSIAAYDCRNSRLLLAALAVRDAIEAARSRFGSHRIGVVLGTSTSGIAEGGEAITRTPWGWDLARGVSCSKQELGTPAQFLARFLDLDGPAYAVSTACTAERQGLCFRAQPPASWTFAMRSWSAVSIRCANLRSTVLPRRRIDFG